MTDYLKAKWQKLLTLFAPIDPVIQPTHAQSWDAYPKRRKK